MGSFNDSFYFFRRLNHIQQRAAISIKYSDGEREEKKERLNKMEMNNNRISFWLLYY